MTTRKQQMISSPVPNAEALFWCVVVFFLSGSPFQTMPSFASTVEMLKYVGGLLALFTLLIKCRMPLSLSLKFFFGLIVMVVSTMLANLDMAPLSYFRFICILSIAFYLSQRYGFRKVARIFVNLMFIITVISLVGHFLLNTSSLLDSLPRMVNSNGREYGIGIVFNYLVEYPERNCGIFWEPGIFATYLIFALMLDILNPSRFSVIRIAAFATGVCTALSTAGFALAVAVIILGVMTLSRKFTRVGSPNLFSLLVFSLLVLVVLNLDTLIVMLKLENNYYINRLLSDELASSVRVLVIIHNLQIFASAPLFGVGISTVSKQIIASADVSTVTYMMSIFGVLACLLPIGFAAGIFRQKHMNIYQKLLVFGIIIAILSKEPHMNMPFMWILFFSLLTNHSALGENKEAQSSEKPIGQASSPYFR